MSITQPFTLADRGNTGSCGRRSLQVGSLLLCVAFVTASSPVSAQTPEIDAEFSQATQAMREGKLDEAGERFAAIVQQRPGFAEAHFNLGLVRDEQGKYEEAIVSLQKALALKPRLHGASLFLGVAEFRLNHLDKAATAIEKETASYPRDASAWMWLGVVRLGQEKPEAAAEALDKAATLKPEDPDILYHRGHAHLLVSNNSYARMFKLDPNSWRAHRVMAQANAEAERHTEAIADYEAAIKLAPTEPGLHEELGSEYRNVNRIPEAEQAFQQELEIDPYNVLARYKLGVLAVEKGDGTKGKELIEAALRQRPGLRHSDYNLGRAEMQLGNDAAAAEDFKRATTAKDSDPEVLQQSWYQLGMVSRKLHRTEEAQQAMAMFQKLKSQQAEVSQSQLNRFKVKQGNSTAAPENVSQDPK